MAFVAARMGVTSADILSAHGKRKYKQVLVLGWAEDGDQPTFEFINNGRAEFTATVHQQGFGEHPETGHRWAYVKVSGYPGGESPRIQQGPGFEHPLLSLMHGQPERFARDGRAEGLKVKVPLFPNGDG